MGGIELVYGQIAFAELVYGRLSTCGRSNIVFLCPTKENRFMDYVVSKRDHISIVGQGMIGSVGHIWYPRN